MDSDMYFCQQMVVETELILWMIFFSMLSDESIVEEAKKVTGDIRFMFIEAERSMFHSKWFSSGCCSELNLCRSRGLEQMMAARAVDNKFFLFSLVAYLRLEAGPLQRAHFWICC